MLEESGSVGLFEGRHLRNLQKLLEFALVLYRGHDVTWNEEDHFRNVLISSGWEVGAKHGVKVLRILKRMTITATYLYAFYN